MSRFASLSTALAAMALIAALPISVSAQTDSAPIAFVTEMSAIDADGVVVIDVRSLTACQNSSLPGARCLPSADFLGPHARLINPRDMLWLLGTVGLTGKEAVIVAGDNAMERDFVAGILFIAGQKTISILTDPISRGGSIGRDRLVAGDGRSLTRESVFQVPMRDRNIILRNELAAALAHTGAPTLIDGRSEKEYWGETVRGNRGGHIPGARNVPVGSLGAASTANHNGLTLTHGLTPVVYGHDAFEGLALLARITAGSDLKPRVYIEGWADWAAHTALPADSVTYPDLKLPVAKAPVKVIDKPMPVAQPADAPISLTPIVLAALLAALVGGGLIGGGYILGLRRITHDVT